MSSSHPVLSLRAKLEDTRTRAVEALAAKVSIGIADLDDLAKIQAALTAVRETVDEHSTRVGWIGDEESLEQAATGVEKRS